MKFPVPFSTSAVLLALFLFQVFVPCNVSAQTSPNLAYDTSQLLLLKPPFSVADYFLLLPESLFTYEGKSKPFDAKTRKLILQSSTSDSARLNGVDFFLGALETEKTFMVINTPESDKGTSFSVALWTYKPTPPKGKKTVAKPLIGWCKRRWTGNGSRSEVRFFTFENKEWREITAKVFPQIKMTEFIQWSGLRGKPDLKPPLDLELARSEQAVIGRLDMQLLAIMPDLKPIAPGLERNVQIRTVELRLRDSVFVITNKY
jgi:hypothetical protein